MERKASLWAASAFALVAGMLFVSQDGQAQTASPAANNEAKQGSTFEDIVVVARRSEENLQSVPISVTAISSEALEAHTVTTGTDLQKLVPTLNVGVSIFGSSQQYSLRGVRTGVVTYFNEVSVPTNVIDLQLWDRSEEHTSELQSLMRITYAVFCLKKNMK